jgi:hypothetical protein
VQKEAYKGLIARLSEWIGRTEVSASRREAALAAVQRLRDDTRPPLWKIDRKALADRTERLIKEPWELNQGGLGICTPAAFTRAWIPRDPVSFVDLISSLYHTGEGRLGNAPDVDLTAALLVPDEDLVEQDYADVVKAMRDDKKPVCPPAEWMVACTLLDDANVAFDYQGHPGEWIADGCSMGPLKSWCEIVGLYSSVERTDSLPDWDDAEALWDYGTVIDKRDVFMSIETDLIQEADQDLWEDIKDFAGGLNHAVTLGRMKVKDGVLEFGCWTWGHARTYSCSPERFESAFNEVVIATL